MIILCIGQAGCQIGNSIINLIDNGCYPVGNRKDERYFPAIFVDIDSKVIHKLRTCNVINKNVKDVNVICGYQTKFKPLFSKDDRFVNKILLHVRDEIIKQNNLCDVVFIHSTIGFTGSTLTKILMAEIKEKFEEVGLVSFAILPFMSGETSFQYYNTMISFNFLKKYCKICFLIGNDHLIDSQTNTQPSLTSINHASAKAILQILNSGLPLFCKKPFQRGTTSYGSKKTMSNDSSVIDVLKSLSSSQFLFVAVKEFENQRLMSQKKALVSLSRSCVNYFPSVLRTPVNKPNLRKAFLFCNVKDEEEISVNIAISCFQKRFQNSLLDNVEICQGTSTHQKHNCSCKPFFVVCFHSSLLETYMNFVAMKAFSMLEANAFVCWYDESKRREETRTAGKKYLQGEYAKFKDMVKSAS